MFFRFLLVTLFLTVASFVLLNSFVYEVPSSYPITTNGNKMLMIMNASTSDKIFTMASLKTETRALEFEITQVHDESFEILFIVDDLTLTVSRKYCAFNEETEDLDGETVRVGIDFKISKIECNGHYRFFNGTSHVNDNEYNVFTVRYITSSPENVFCAFAKNLVMFPRMTSTTVPTSSEATTTEEEHDTGLSKFAIIAIVMGCVAFVLVVAAITLGVFLCKRKKVLCFKKVQPRPWYLPSPSQDVEGTPSKYTCRAGQYQRKKVESNEVTKTLDSIEAVPSKIKLYKTGEYANLKPDSTATAIPRETSVTAISN